MTQINAIDGMNALRQKLFNLSIRNNNMLNYKETKKSVSLNSSITIYNELVFKNGLVFLDSITEADDETEERTALIYRNAKTVFEEQGYPALYVAVGFLNWFDKEGVKEFKAPILLIPVEMKKSGKNRKYTIAWTGDDIYTSLTLQAKMKDFNITIPDFPMPEDSETLNTYFKNVEESIKNKNGWSISNEVKLDLFNFQKFVMYKDLDPALWSMKDMEKEYPLIFNLFEGKHQKYRTDIIKPDEVDDKVNAKKSYNVVDADSSQMAVIENAKNGLSMVIEGPPGTGKSQTIVNVIAELMAEGKTILFISEKMAALNVVKTRLDKVGLGDLCLEIHSKQAKKTAVLKSINDSLEDRKIIKINDMECDKERDTLNNYAKIIREPVGNVYNSYYELLGAREEINKYFEARSIKMPVYKLNNPEAWTFKEYEEAKAILKNFSTLAKDIIPVKNNAWFACKPKIMQPIEVPEIENMFIEAIEALNNCKEAIKELSDISCVRVIRCFNDMEDMIQAASLLVDINKIPVNLVHDRKEKKIFTIEETASEINNLKICVAKFMYHDKNKRYSKGISNLIQNKVIDEEKIIECIKNVNDTKQKFNVLLQKITNTIDPDFNILFETIINEATFDMIINRLVKWRDNTNTLITWTQAMEHIDTGKNTRMFFMVKDFLSGKIDTRDLIKVFEGNYINCIIGNVNKENKKINRFNALIHENSIEAFKTKDKNILNVNAIKVHNIVKENMEKAIEEASINGDMRALSSANKKRSIRTLICNSGALIQAIKPCFMMSPVSVAQHIDPRSIKFDVIIFDEASQIKPEQAIGTLLRGKQAIVMGDSKQLPPTSFFDKVVNLEDTEFEDFNSVDEESILNVCKTVFPVKTLSWHYRSRHESLITVSNKEFYENKLMVYPSPKQKDTTLGLKFVHLPNGIYERGTTGINRIEAKAVASAVFNHYANNTDKSIGVGCFNIKQQQAIQEEIEKLSREYPDINLDNGTEPLFIKNLETIQGDERDVILLSVGFGFDQDKKLSYNFGALNQTGGERRLNVLLTRAREKCIIYANFRACDMQIENIASIGVNALKTFLDFAENNESRMNYNTEAKDNSLENSVREFLMSEGYEIHKDIGCSGYKINLAIPDNENNGAYSLGIECDGENYHNYTVCRDRDRLRAQVLEGLGWKLVKVWSIGWYFNPEGTKKALLEAIRGYGLYPAPVGNVNSRAKFLLSA